MTDLMNVDRAVEHILAQITQLNTETVHLADAAGRILAEAIYSAIDLPPFPNSSMDGYAVRAADVATTPVALPVVMDIPAGFFPTQSLQAGEAARIMTGAPIPDGADAVIPVEDTDSVWSLGDTPPATVTIHIGTKSGSNVRPIGENVKHGQLILAAGIQLRPQDIGMLASLGYAQVQVTRQPRVVILTTGDELVNLGEPLTPGKIHDSNSYALASLVAQHGGIPAVLPIGRDTLESIQNLFQSALELNPDLVISSAGVSVGAADYTKTVLETLGQVNFWRINLRPGKPLVFGMLTKSDQEQVPFFGLPGNPVSAMVTFDVCVRPALFKMIGRTDEPETAIAVTEESFTSDGR
ncbi:MAG TPA: gephyrin-like molybdotransferase Glp, partial [Phototrophicaceae bacterium]|nr:gephyrin-like molybdotransferase Glp [Phototrophicaceae bacterium]